MSILLLVLKIIGIILLSILGLILLIICMALFVPVRYKAVADKENDKQPQIVLNISYLLHIISIYAKYEGNFDFYIKILGIKYRKRSKKEKKTAIDKKNDESRSDIKESFDDIINDKIDVPTSEDYTIDWNDEGDEELIESTSYNEEDSSNVTEEDAEDKEREALIDKLVEAVQRIIDSLKNLEGRVLKIANITESKLHKMHSFYKLINDTSNKKALKYIFNQIKYIVKSIIPRKIKGFIHFGFDDPATTGQIISLLAIMAPFYNNSLKVYPDFENNIIECDIKLNGRVFGYVFVVAGIKLLLNKEVRRLWKLYRKH